jgi:hypothetical protein
MPLRRLFFLALLMVGLLVAQSTGPRYTADGRLEFPAGYREWIFLSAGRGMTYGPAAGANAAPLFDNVFVLPSAYHAFLETGQWPEGTMFVLEIRSAGSEESINTGGQFQKELRAVEVEVKDKRFTETNGWAYFNFGGQREPVAALPKTAACYSCHEQNGAVENTFVQFYPTLIDAAKAHGVYRSR